MDGVLWQDKAPLPGVGDFFRALAQDNCPYVFATNNSTRSPADYAVKIRGLGIAVEEGQIITSSTATAAFLADRHPQGGPLYIVGEGGLRGALAAEGFYPSPEDSVLAVVAGLDRQISYEKIRRAGHLIRAGVPFIGTNPDKTYPTPQGLAPGAGSILAAIEAAGGQAPLIIGKPHPPMFQQALKLLGSPPVQTLMIGDRLDTDIAGARALDMKTALVLTGVSTEADIINSSVQADGVFADLVHLLQAYQSS
jgi:4-nitrophenyl phosphatase